MKPRPCPFCGSAPIVEHSNSWVRSVTISCANLDCPCFSSLVTETGLSTAAALVKALAAWNGPDYHEPVTALDIPTYYYELDFAKWAAGLLNRRRA